MRLKTTILGLALMALVCVKQASATVTPTAWYHFGEGGVAIQNDATSNTNNFNSAYFQCTPPLVGTTAAGGPLGASLFQSTNSARFGLNGCVTEFYRSGTLNPTTTNYYVPPPANFGMEFWYLAQNKGYVSDGTQGAFTPIFATGGSIFGAGPGGGVAVVVIDNLDGTSSLEAAVVHAGDSAGAFSYFGPSILIDTNNWIHLALVNDNGTLVFYTNGVPCATNDNSSNPLTDSGGTLFIGRDGGHVSIDGYLDEVRVFTFAPGAFSVSDLLYHPSPRVVTQPQNVTVWDSGAANIFVNTSADTGNTFQWYQGVNLLGGKTSANLNLDPVALANSGNQYDCAITNNGNGQVTSNATLTVAAVQTANAAAYQTSVNSEPSLVAYFPVDGSSGPTVANTKDGTHNGTLEMGALYDGQTNRAFGSRALYLRGNGDVRIPSNSSYEFGSGNGTIEALIYLTQTANGGDATIFSVATADGTAIRYSFAAAGDGSALICTNDSGVNLIWPIGANLLNRLAHVALVFSGTTTVTAYADGLSLGAKTQTGFGSASGVPAWIGSATTNSPTLWNGTIDEVAVYNSALSASTIAIHNSKFIFGTNTSAPTIVSQSSSKTIYAGGSPILAVSVSGTPPLNYQWRSNNIVISGATGPTLTLPNVAAHPTAAYTVDIGNSFGSTNNNSNPINLTVINPPDSYASSVMVDHPLAFWRLDESSGTNMTDYAGELDGTYTGTLTLGAPGIIASDSAASFSAGKGIVPYSSLLNPSGPFTVEFWGMPTADASGNGYTAIASQNRSAGRSGYVIYVDNNAFVGGVNSWEAHIGNASAVTAFIASPTPIILGQWYHVALTYDGGSNATLYVFGYPAASASNLGNGGYLPNAAQPFQIGRRTSGDAFPFVGTLDEVAFYNYALSQSQLQSHVTLGLPLKVSIASSPNVVADSKPSSPPYDGFNNGGTWLASSSDGTTTRNGVMQFTATNSTGQVTDFGYSAFNNSTGTIMLWMRSAGTTGGGAEGAILFDWRSSVGLALVQHDAGTVFIQAQNNYNHFDSVATVSDNKWHHVAITFDQTALGGVTLYIDGTQDSTALNTQAWAWPVGQLLELGRDTLYDGGYWRNYDGELDDFRIYNRMLSQSEISQAMSGNVVDSSALQVRLNFDSPPGGYAVSWPYGSLQSAAAVTGPYNTVSNISSPFPIAPLSQPQKFFRGLR